MTTNELDQAKSLRIGQWLTVGGAIAIILGSLLPWGTMTTIFGSVSISGTEGDGVITLVFGVILLGLAVMQMTESLRRDLYLRIAAWVTFAVCGFIAVSVFTGLNDIGGSDYGHISVGVGVYLIAAGALSGAIGADKARRPVN